MRKGLKVHSPLFDENVATIEFKVRLEGAKDVIQSARPVVDKMHASDASIPWRNLAERLENLIAIIDGIGEARPFIGMF